jgi:hypothetical protein
MWFSSSPNVSAPITQEDVNTLPGYFPATTRNCATISQPFFDCFSKQAVKSTNTDTEAGVRGLKACTKELLAYKFCMEKTLATGSSKEKRFRVSKPLLLIVIDILFLSYLWNSLQLDRYKKNIEINPNS